MAGQEYYRNSFDGHNSARRKGKNKKGISPCSLSFDRCLHGESKKSRFVEILQDFFQGSFSPFDVYLLDPAGCLAGQGILMIHLHIANRLPSHPTCRPDGIHRLIALLAGPGQTPPTWSKLTQHSNTDWWLSWKKSTTNYITNLLTCCLHLYAQSISIHFKLMNGLWVFIPTLDDLFIWSSSI